MHRKLFILIMALTIGCHNASPVIIDNDAKARARSLVNQMTIDEKLSYISGETRFSIRPVERLGIPRILMADGPQGIRNHCEHSTLYPCGIMSAATWNRSLIHSYGESLADDAKARGVGILLGPGVNIYRSPLCGRNFEYMGEDPYLSSEIACEYIDGVQSRGVIATIKHFAANNQEWNRHHTSSDVDERTLQEIYFPTFRKAVKKCGVGAVMNSYNLLNGIHATENKWLNTKILREDWNFDGILMSDWTSVYSTVNAANSGLDLEMPSGVFFNDSTLRNALETGKVTMKTIDDKVAHMLQTFIAFGLLDRDAKDKSIPLDNPAARRIALETARQGIVLLKNDDNLLPLKGSCVVVGVNADTIVGGGGSGAVNPFSYTPVSKALCRFNKKAKYFDESDRPKLEKAVREADNVIICTGFNAKSEGEGFDRNFALPDEEENFIRDMANINNNVIVIINSGGAVDTRNWGESVKAILMAWYPGQEGGTAIAEILTGRVSPSGKLPISYDRSPEESPISDSYYANRPKVRRADKMECAHVEYKEGIFPGYRGYDRMNKTPLYPFGYGLSYSTFEFSDLDIQHSKDEKIEVKFKLSNTGKCKAAEVAQIYVGMPESRIVRPVKELKGFEKVELKPGESRDICIILDREAFQYFDMDSGNFSIEPGSYLISVGNSSAHLPLTGTVTIN